MPSLPISYLSPYVKDFGGHLITRGGEAIARFGDACAWTFDCVMGMGPEQTVPVATSVTWRMSYHGSKNRLDPLVQREKKGVNAVFWNRVVACQAMLCPTTGLHGKTLEQVKELLLKESGGYIEEEELTLDVVRITADWSVLAAEGDLWWFIGRKVLRSPPYLVRDRAIYVPLARWNG